MEFSARDGGWSAYRWGSFQRLMDVIYGRAAVDTLKTCVSKQQGSFGLVLDCEKQGFQKALNKWGAGWNLVGHLLMQSDTFENPRPQSCWEYETCHLFRTLLFMGSSLSPTFFFFFSLLGGSRQVPSLFLVFYQTFFPRQACRRHARLVGQSHWHGKHLWLKTSPLLRHFHLLHWTEPLVKITSCHHPPSDAARQRQAAEYQLEHSQAMEEWIESFMPSSGCDFWLGLSLVNILMAPVLGLWNGSARLGDRSGLKCPCATWKQLEVKVFGKGNIVCSLFST